MPAPPVSMAWRLRRTSSNGSAQTGAARITARSKPARIIVRHSSAIGGAGETCLGKAGEQDYNRTGRIITAAFAGFHMGLFGRSNMFDSLADQIRQDERGTETNAQRLVVWAAALVCVLRSEEHTSELQSLR